jgi:ribosomal protein L23
MCTRIPRLWQPGDPQTRVYLTDFWLHLIQIPNVGREALPSNAALFEVHPSMSRLDVRQYLEKIYRLPVRDVRIRVCLYTKNIKLAFYRTLLAKSPTTIRSRDNIDKLCGNSLIEN